METFTCVYSTPKAGNQSAENQDAYAHPADKDGYCRLDEQRFAMADGATEALYSGVWARLLVESWAMNAVADQFDWEVAFSALEGRWQSQIPQEALPWWAEQKIAQGAFSTFLGLTLQSERDGTVRTSMCAVGDTCAFVIREDKLVLCWPLVSSKSFGSSPYLIGSSAKYNRAINENLVTHSTTLKRFDRLIVATDALACWYLSKCEAGADASSLFHAFEEQPDKDCAFQAFIASERNSNQMRNDDVTLMLIDLL